MVDDISVNTLVAVIKTHYNGRIFLTKRRAQCYGGASTMRGAKTGVTKKLSDEERRVVYYGVSYFDQYLDCIH